MQRLEEIAANRADRQSKRRHQRKMQTNQFIKSMQMLQSNCKPDHSEPFEDYSIFLYRQTAPNFEDRVKDLEKKFTYVPDRENRMPVQSKGEKDEDFQARIKDIEEKWQETVVAEKKPKDLMRAIGKIDNSDWNIKEIEKKILENKMGKNVNKDKERVPKWSREQFLARQTKMEKQHLERQDSGQAKYAEIDKSIKQLDQKLKEGTVREINQQRIAKITEKLQTKADTEPKAPPPVQKNNSKSVVLPTQGNSESCHFCSKRVYLMERLSAEGRFFHRGCFRCQYCHTALRLGSYMFDRDGKYGYRFYCSQHFGMPGELKVNRVVRKPSVKNKENIPSSDKKLSGVAGVDLLDRVQTPERIEFSNLSVDHPSDHEESLSQMDEDEWTDRNFGASAAEMGSSDDDSSSLSETDSDDEEAYEEALEEPPTKEGTLKWAERYNRRYSRKRDDSESDEYSSSDQSSYYENSSGDDDSDTATEGEEEIRARELRKQEVRVEPPLHTDTGTDTEIASDETTTESSSEVHNSATEISTDSEFAHDDPTPTREVPSIVFNDAFVTKTRGKYSAPQKVQIKSTEIARPSATVAKTQSRDVELKFTPLVLTPIVRKPVQPLLIEGYALNRTQSTGGIATKVSLELKKKYLLGETASSNSIQKSGSTSTLDSKLKSFHSTITDCQKLLKPATDGGGKPPLSPLFSPVKEVEKQEEVKAEPFENVNEGRPRSPVHETSIIVPQIDWSQQKQPAASSGGSSSCTSSSSSSDSEVRLKKSPSVRAFDKIPRVEVQDVDLPPDSLNYDYVKLNESQPSSINEPPKSIASERKALNPPKALPNLAGDVLLNQVHAVLHGRPKTDEQSGRSTPDSCVDQVTAVLTETELSDWARDGTVSDDLDDFDLNPKRSAKPKKKVDVVHVCGKTEPPLSECVNDILRPDLDNIEFMDTGTESSDDGGVVEVKNNGYVQFHDEDDIAEDSLSPAINVGVVEATNPKIRATFDDDDLDDLSTASKNTGYCIIENEKNHFGGEVIDLKPSDLEKLKEKRNLCENEEDSLLIIEPGTTTEENTCSDSTVKNVTQIVPDKEKTIAPPPPPLDNNNLLDKKRLEDKLAQVKKDMKKLNEQRKAEQIEEQNLRNNIEFEQHCQRLQSKVDFGNARDSIDVRKSRRQSKTGSPPKPDLIREEKEASPVRSRREQIEMERDLNKRLVQEMVMNKMRAQNKSLERKRRNRNSFSPSVSPCRPFDRMTGPTPDVLLSTIGVQKSQTVADFASEPKAAPRARYSPTKVMARPLSVHAALVSKMGDKVEDGGSAAEALSLPDIHKALVAEQLDTPKAPPRVRNEDAKKNVERLKEDARARARLMSDEALGLSPEDKLAKLRQRVNSRNGKENDVDVHIQDSIESLVVNTERRNSQLYANDTLSKKKNGSFRRSKSGEEYSSAAPYDKERTKSVNELNKPPLSVLQPKGAESEKRDKFHKSDPNLLSNLDKKEKKKSKDRERRKSITKMFTDLFAKKKESGASSPNGNRSFLARISPKARDKSKSCIDLHQRDSNVIKEEPPQRHMSFSELRRSVPGNVSPPPIPPLPLNYSGTKSGIDDSSDGESEWKRADKSSCDTLDRSGVADSSSSNRRSGRSARKAARQSQLKRHRMAQEVQRKLEETEVKTRELERRGVRLEKAIRGELEEVPKDETELLKEWFDLTRDMTEMRRYERELMIRAQELELEDRHARLQHELKERLESDGQKTEEDFETEGSIIKEMMDIVRKRDSLVTLLEEDCRRYAEEDRGLEEMLAKGISLTPIQLKIADK